MFADAMTDADRDYYESWELALAALHAELAAGRKLTPREMIEAIDRERPTT